MKYFCLLELLIVLQLYCAAQNTGIGTATPLQKLDVNGAIKIGNTATNEAGTIRYNNNNFEGGDGNAWRSLEALPSKAIIVAQEPDTAFLKTKGFTVLRQLDVWDTSYFNVPQNNPGLWNNGFPLSSGTAPTNTSFSPESVFYNGRFIYYGFDGYLYAYTVATQSWAQLPGLSPLGTRYAYGMSLSGNEIYITGGYRFVAGTGFVIYNTCAKYNLTSNTWISIANMPVTNCYHPSSANATDVYVLNGSSTFNGTEFVISKKLYRYNIASNTWSADLATANTPNYLPQGYTVNNNGKYLYASSVIYNSGGNDYISIYEFDPVSQTNNSINAAVPWPFTMTTSFRYCRTLLTAAGKAVVMGYVADSTDINYSAADPGATSTTMGLFYEVDLATGIATPINSCKLVNNTINIWQYSAASGLLYMVSSNGDYFNFNRSGSESCNLVLKRRGYWSYMKKN